MKSKILILFLVLGITLFVLNGCVGPTPEKKEPVFKMAMVTWVGYGPLYLAEEKGFFKEEGIQVELSVIEDVAARKSALKTGDLDGVADLVDSLILERDENVPAVAVMAFDVSNGADGIITIPEIKTISDLKGKTVAVQKNFVEESFLLYLLEKNNIPVSDVKMIDMESGAAGAAFVAGQVDAAATWEPWLSKAKERKGGGKILVTSADEPGVIVDIFSVNENVLKNRPDEVQKVMRAWFKAVDYWKNNPEEANILMAKHYGVSPEEFKEFISGLKWPEYEENKAYFVKDNAGNIYDVAEIYQKLFLKLGKIKDKINIESAVDTSLLNNLYS